MSRLVRRDANHQQVVDALRAAGCSVWDAAGVGGGFPDLVVGRVVAGRPVTYLLEVKDGTLSPSRRALNDLELAWHGQHLGHVAVVLSVDDALRAVGLLP
jgi:hypothetical protein